MISEDKKPPTKCLSIILLKTPLKLKSCFLPQNSMNLFDESDLKLGCKMFSDFCKSTKNCFWRFVFLKHREKKCNAHTFALIFEKWFTTINVSYVYLATHYISFVSERSCLFFQDEMCISSLVSNLLLKVDVLQETLQHCHPQNALQQSPPSLEWPLLFSTSVKVEKFSLFFLNFQMKISWTIWLKAIFLHHLKLIQSVLPKKWNWKQNWPSHR